MNGVPEAVGVGVSKLVDINPAIGILVALLIVLLGVVAKWGLDGHRGWRAADKRHSDYVEAQLVEEKKTQERLDRVLEQSSTARRGR